MLAQMTAVEEQCSRVLATHTQQHQTELVTGNLLYISISSLIHRERQLQISPPTYSYWAAQKGSILRYSSYWATEKGSMHSQVWLVPCIDSTARVAMNDQLG